MPVKKWCSPCISSTPLLDLRGTLTLFTSHRTLAFLSSLFTFQVLYRDIITDCVDCPCILTTDCHHIKTAPLSQSTQGKQNKARKEEEKQWQKERRRAIAFSTWYFSVGPSSGILCRHRETGLFE